MCLTVGALLIGAGCGGAGGGGSSGGGGSGPATDPGTPSGNYVVTVTATAGSLTHTLSFTLVIQ
jgi:hypothetical protein